MRLARTILALALRAPCGRTVELGADDQGQAVLFRGEVGAHDTRQRAFIGQRQSRVIQGFGLRDQFFRLRGAAQKREIAQGMQFDVHLGPLSEYAVHVPAFGLALLKNPQPHAIGMARNVVITRHAFAIPPTAFDTFRALQ